MEALLLPVCAEIWIAFRGSNSYNYLIGTHSAYRDTGNKKD